MTPGTSTWTSIGDPDLLSLPSHRCCSGALLVNLPHFGSLPLHFWRTKIFTWNRICFFFLLCRPRPSSKSRTREPSGSPCSSKETSPSVFSAQEERVCTDRSELRSDLQFYGRPGSSQVQRSLDPSEEVPVSSSSTLKTKVTNSEETPTLDSFCPHPTTEEQEQNQSSGWCSALVPTPRFGRQLSEGGVCSSSQNPFPFPKRRPPRLSEAARRLGLYSPWEPCTTSWTNQIQKHQNRKSSDNVWEARETNQEPNQFFLFPVPWS